MMTRGRMQYRWIDRLIGCVPFDNFSYAESAIVDYSISIGNGFRRSGGFTMGKERRKLWSIFDKLTRRKRMLVVLRSTVLGNEKY